MAMDPELPALAPAALSDSLREDDAAVRAPQVQLNPREGRRLELGFSGTLPPDWKLRLARGLAARRIGLLTGYGRRVSRAGWLAQIEIELGYGREPVPDFLELAIGSDAPTPVEPALLDFELEPSAALGGSLALRVDAWDAIGLLATVLGHADRAGLYAAEFLLETEEECAFHELTLQSRDWRPPSPDQERALARSLGTLLPR